MIRYPALALLLAALGLDASPAWSCIVTRTLAKQLAASDLVVVGTVENYEIVLDQESREVRKRDLLRTLGPDLSPELKGAIREKVWHFPDYTRFDIRVEEVLAGDAPERVAVYWPDTMFGETGEKLAGPRIFALLAPNTVQSVDQLHVFPDPRPREPNARRILSRDCGPFFMDPVGSDSADEIRAALTP